MPTRLGRETGFAHDTGPLVLAPTGRAMPGAARSRPWFWAVCLLAIAAVAIGATKLDWPAVVAALRGTDPTWFAAACGCFMMLPVLMAAEWRLIGARPSDAAGDLRTLFPLACFTYFVQTYLNAAVAYGTAMLRLVRGSGWTIGQGIGLVTVDQAAEGISRGAFCGMVLLLAAGSLTTSPWLIVAIGPPAVLVVGFTVVRGKAFVRRMITARLMRSGQAAEALDEVLAVMTLRSFAWGITLATAKKAAKIGAVAAIESALGTGGSPWSAIYFVAILECATTLPLVPGNLGVIESAAVTVYVSLGLPAETGLSIGLLYRAGIHLATGAMAAAALAATCGSRRPKLAREDESSAASDAEPRSQAA